MSQVKDPALCCLDSKHAFAMLEEIKPYFNEVPMLEPNFLKSIEFSKDKKPKSAAIEARRKKKNAKKWLKSELKIVNKRTINNIITVAMEVIDKQMPPAYP